MYEILEILRYMRLKLLISVFRGLARLAAPRPRSNPGAVITIPSRDPSRTIKTHVYQPQAADESAEHPLPVLINFFGGGFTLDLHGADDLFCRRVASQAGYVVLDVNYRLAPEHPFPAAINDAEDAVHYVLAHPDEYDASQISLSGFSSGGTCALALLTVFPQGTFRSAITFYPSTNAAEDPGLRVAPVPGGKRLPSFWTRIFREAYFGKADPRDPRISPINADVSTFPDRMVMITAEQDASALESEALAEKVSNEGGREMVMRRMKSVGHNFDKRTDFNSVEAREESYQLAIASLQQTSSREP